MKKDTIRKAFDRAMSRAGFIFIGAWFRASDAPKVKRLADVVRDDEARIRREIERAQE